ncbi:MAG: Mrp/NBP35 family ATP-binding protein [Dehalococcoidia bacterium]|jgi:ATP-binding protein involved in chromosome partitioning|nr:Mrp/NBP35 family ATP-binding protein [Dehalococcoidia bacterium]
MTQQQRELTPEERARVEGMKRNWEQKRLVNERLQQIGKRIGVYSGKGGVGKTTVAVNLAVMLAQEGARVGLFDCDIDCPNVTRVMRISDGPTSEDGQVMAPPSRFGVKVMSMSMFQENEEEATIWRGPMIHNAINQFLTNTDWGELDYMVIDLPPGTSDAPLTVMQTLNVDGFVVVTTPQELAALDAKRSINMVKKLNLDVLGVVENMSGDIFGRGAGEQLAEETELPFLGRVEMRADYQQSETKPTVFNSDAVADEFHEIAEGVRKRLVELDPES